MNIKQYRLLIGIILIPCILCFLAGCCIWSPEFKEAFESDWTIENGMAFKAEIKRHVLRRGDRAEVELTIRNISGESMIIPRNICGNELGLLFVLDEDGEFEISDYTPRVDLRAMKVDDYMILPHGRYMAGKRFFCIKTNDFGSSSTYYFEDMTQGTIFELKKGENYEVLYTINQDESEFLKESDKGFEKYTLKDVFGVEQWQGDLDLNAGEIQVVD